MHLFCHSGLGRKETWETLDPYGLIDELVRANITVVPEMELKKYFKKVRSEMLVFESRKLFLNHHRYYAKNSFRLKTDLTAM